jgi:hypothetical protein
VTTGQPQPTGAGGGRPGGGKSPAPLPGLQGAIAWAVVPYDVRQPFDVVPDGGDPVTYENAGALGEAVRRREIGPEFVVSVGAKVRPVLLLQDRPAGRLREYAALKLNRMDKLAEGDQDAVRRQEMQRFFHLPDPRRVGLGTEFAVDLLSLVRIHETALVGNPVGKLNSNEFRVVCERLVRVMDLDLAHLVVREASDFLKRQGLA